MSPDGREVYVSNWGKKSVSVIDTDPSSSGTYHEVLETIGLAGGDGDIPEGLDFTPDGTRVYVAIKNERVAYIDTATRDVYDVTAVIGGSRPTDVLASPDGLLVYVANAGDHSVSVIDTTMNMVTHTISTDGGGSHGNPQFLALNSDGSRLYVSQTIGSSAVVDTTTQALDHFFWVHNSAAGIAVVQLQSGSLTSGTVGWKN